MQRFFLNSTFLIIEKVFSAGFGFVFLIILANSYDTTSVGLYIYGLSIAVVISTILLLCDEKIIKKYVINFASPNIFIQGSYLKFVLSFFIIIISIIFGWINESHSFILLFLSIQLVTQSIAYTFLYCFDLDSKSIYRVAVSFVGNSVTFSLQLYFIFTNASITLIAFSGVIGSSLMLVISLVLFYNNITNSVIKNSLNFDIIKKVLFESWPFAIAAAAHILYMRMDILMIEYYLGLDATVYYAYSVQLISVGTLIIYPFQTALFPMLVREHKKLKQNKFKGVLLSITSLSTKFAYLLAIIAILCIEYFLNIFLPKDYIIIMDFFIFQVFTMIIFYNSIIRSSYITINNIGFIILITQVLALLLNFILNIYLINKFGITGAAVATLLSTFAALFFSNLLFNGTKGFFKIQLAALIRIKLKHDFNILTKTFN